MGLKKNLRTALIVIITILVLALSYIFISELVTPHFREEKKTLFRCENKADAKYQVFLKPNLLYEEQILDEGHYIISQYVDYIKASYTYAYKGDKKAAIIGDYEITGVLEAYSGEAEKKVVIWNKKYVFLPKTQIEQKESDSFNINKEINLDLSQFNEFIQMVVAESRINASTQLNINMNVHIKVITDKGIIEESLSPSLAIPLMSSYFKISGFPSEDKPRVIEETIKRPLPANYQKVYLFIAGDALLLILLVFILFFTRSKEVDLMEKLLTQIFKKHGDRMVALKSRVSEAYELKYEVRSIEDLVRISDEINKPIVYQLNEVTNNIGTFYVLNNLEMYFYKIEDTANIPRKYYSDETNAILIDHSR